MSDIVKDSKRKAIIEAAEDEFVQKGYDGARILEIAERAGVGHPLLYYHFKTKKELFECVVKQKIGLLQRAVLVSWDDSNGSVTDKLCQIIGDHFDFVKLIATNHASFFSSIRTSFSSIAWSIGKEFLWKIFFF